MADNYTLDQVLGAIASASKVLSSRKEEINCLNVFPVPDGDTGTNMSLTIETVVDGIAKLPANPSRSEACRTITTGALMGARGNSGVITSQILRGACEAASEQSVLNTESVEAIFARAQEVAFQAVRKPVEGTILTVLKDAAAAAKWARRKKLSTEDALWHVVEEAYASVQRTPEFLPVLKENNVVDAGGFGLAIFIEAFVAALTGTEGKGADELEALRVAQPKVEIEQINDWEGSAYRYCNEFLVDSDTLDKDKALEFLATMGDCELCVGCAPKFKVHVHSNTPDKVLHYFLKRGQISEVFIHNMQLQSEERTRNLEARQVQQQQQQAASKPYGFVAVTAGPHTADILCDMGVDVVVSGGQTMNPSTRDILDAIAQVDAQNIIIFPNNKNIVMAAQSACGLAGRPCAVVPTSNVLQEFSAMIGFDETLGLDENISSMSEAFEGMRVLEITTAVKDSKDAHDHSIKTGDVIGIVDGALETEGSSVVDVALALLAAVQAEDADVLTILTGADCSEDELNALLAAIEESYDNLEVEAYEGGQPLYPIMMSVE